MNLDMPQIFHLIGTCVSSAVAAYFTYLKIQEKKEARKHDDHKDRDDEFNQLRSKVDVLEERSKNEAAILDRLSNQIDKLIERL